MASSQLVRLSSGSPAPTCRPPRLSLSSAPVCTAGGVARVRRVQGAGAGIDGAARKALEAQGLGAPPLRPYGAAGAVAGVAEHGRGPGAAEASRVRGRRGCSSILLVRTGVGRRGARACGPGRRHECGGRAAAPKGVDCTPGQLRQAGRRRGLGSGKWPPRQTHSAARGFGLVAA